MSIQKAYSHTPHWRYDVFLSFRGEDTRKNFTDHLYNTLVQRGIHAFRDDQELGKGKAISLELLQAIAESRISVIIFSKNYASSTWCLNELVQIVECMNTKGQKVFPIFYGVDPSTVRKQTGSFQEAFNEHEKDRENIEQVQKWRNALTQVANLSGWDAKDRHESELIQQIVKEISSKSSVSTCMNLKDLIGIDSRLEKLMTLIGIGSNDVRMIGIYGMGGIGKTTIAKVAYEKISYEFDGSCFLENVRIISEKSNGLVSLQMQLLSKIQGEKELKIWDTNDGISEIRKRLQRTKVLVVIDDVTDANQLEKLVGNHNWFGLGSRIIITTRDEHVLRVHGVDKVYEAQRLNSFEAFQLFNLKAFDHGPLKEYEELSKYFVKYIDGLPLALKVLGSFLLGRTIDEWRSAQERLESDYDKEILDVLQLSFDALGEKEKKIFLDIACFFNGHQRDYVTRILDGCGFNSTIGISLLVNKSLITISENYELQIHDLLREMGRQIVKKECPEEPGKRSRVWTEEDVLHVLTNNTGTEHVEGIVLEEKLHLDVSAKAFSKMINLRLLKIHNVQLPKGLDFLSNKLRLLIWHGYPLKLLPSNLQLNKIVELDLSYSRIKQLWKGIQLLNELKSLTLRECHNLYKTPDFTGAPNLEKLVLEGCTMLREIHPSLLNHKKISILILRNCTSLTTFPSDMHMESLRVLDLSGCSKLKFEQEECMEKLDIKGTANRPPASSIFDVENLKKYYFSICKGSASSSRNSKWFWRLLASMMLRSSNSITFRLPSLLGCPSITDLRLRGCNIGEGAVPHEIGNISSLTRLDLSRNQFVSLPASIGKLHLFNGLFLEGCDKLQFVPEIPNSTSFLEVSGCVSLDTSSCGKRFWNLFEGVCCLFGVNCPNLHRCKTTMAFSILKDYLIYIAYKRTQDPNFSITPFPRPIFHVAVPGSEIPKWCHQKQGSSITIHMHPDLYNNCKLVGYVACCVFLVNKRPPREDAFDQMTDRHMIGFYRSSVDPVGNINPAVSFVAEESGQALSEHTYLIFFPQAKCKEIYNPIKCSFRVLRGAGLEVKRCGVRPIYEHEVDDLFNESSDSAFSNLDKFPYEDFVGSTMDDDSESSDSECSVCSCSDQETKISAITDLFGHLNEYSVSKMKDFAVRSTTDVIVNIKRSIRKNDEEESSLCGCCDDKETKVAVNNFLNTLVPEIKDFVGSTAEVTTTKRRRDEAEPNSSSGCCDLDEPQPKRANVEIEFACRCSRLSLEFLF